MAWNINRVVIIGRLTKDVEVKHTQSGIAYGKISIAVNSGKQSNGENNSSFFDVYLWEKLVENTAPFLLKGKLICIDGKLEQKQWTDKEGNKKSSVNISAEKIEFLSPIDAQYKKQEGTKIEDSFSDTDTSF